MEEKLKAMFEEELRSRGIKVVQSGYIQHMGKGTFMVCNYYIAGGRGFADLTECFEIARRRLL